jgi:hypothetical protein
MSDEQHFSVQASVALNGHSYGIRLDLQNGRIVGVTSPAASTFLGRNPSPFAYVDTPGVEIDFSNGSSVAVDSSWTVGARIPVARAGQGDTSAQADVVVAYNTGNTGNYIVVGTGASAQLYHWDADAHVLVNVPVGSVVASAQELRNNAIDSATLQLARGLSITSPELIIRAFGDRPDIVRQINQGLYDRYFGSPPDHCFAADTLVSRPDGTSVAIQFVKPGDEILSFRGTASHSSLEPRRVVRVMQNVTQEWLLIRLPDASPLVVTPGHRFVASDAETIGNFLGGNSLIERAGLSTAIGTIGSRLGTDSRGELILGP